MAIYVGARDLAGRAAVGTHQFIVLTYDTAGFPIDIAFKKFQQNNWEEV